MLSRGIDKDVVVSVLVLANAIMGVLSAVSKKDRLPQPVVESRPQREVRYHDPSLKRLPPVWEEYQCGSFRK